MEVDADNFIVVQGADGIIHTDEGICLQSKRDGALYFVQPTKDVLEMFKLSWRPPPNSPNISASNDDHGKRTKWPEDAILMLINLRIQYDKQFKSTSTKNETTWKKISDELKHKGYNLSSTQCNDKWRYLKGRYTAKKDNMGDRGTGEAAVEFAYFEAMDNFLKNKHNIQPVAIASSIQGENDKVPGIKETDDVDDDDALEPPNKKKKVTSNVTKLIKKKKNSLQVLMEDMKETNLDRETGRERRHKEIIEARNNALNVFSAKMDLLIETLNKK